MRQTEGVHLQSKAAFLALIALLLAAFDSGGAVTWTRYDSRPGSKVRIEGISTRTDWQVESTLLGGFLEVGPGFPEEHAQSARPGKMEARAQVFVPIRSLKSVDKSGQPFSDEMDKIMYGNLAPEQDPKARLTFQLTELVLRESAKSRDEPYLFDSKGELAIAGVTNAIAMPITVLPLEGKKIRISGAIPIKMTDYRISPPTPRLSFGPLKTGDEVKVIFEWIVAERTSAAAATVK